MYQEMVKCMNSHIYYRIHGMIGVGRSLVQKELRVPEMKLRLERYMQGPDHNVLQAMLRCWVLS